MKIDLMHGDCLELMKSIPSNSIDLVLTDPPYSSGGLFAGDRKRTTSEKYTDTGYCGASRYPDFSGDNMDQRSFTSFMREVLFRARLKSKNEAVCLVFVDWRNLAAMTDALQMAGWIFRGIVVWNKGVARNIPGRFRQDCEFIVWGTNGAKTVDYTPGFSAYPGVYDIKSVASSKKNHQTEKPVELLEKLIAISPDGATVLDAFMGSGSTGVACVNTNRAFIGIELNEQYFQIATERIAKAGGEL